MQKGVGSRKCLLMKKMWYIYTMEYDSAVKEQNNAIFLNMDGPRDGHTE